MDSTNDWKKYWDEKSEKATSDYNFDRGGNPRKQELEELSERELIEFIDPQPGEVVFDAGCGTGAVMFLLASRVKRVSGVDFAPRAVERCRQRIVEAGIVNMEIWQGSVTQLPVQSRSVDKLLCMSVFQYLNDSEVNAAMKEFARALRPGGIVVMHVKNLSSLYLSTLRAFKRVKLALGFRSKVEYVRSFGWYVRLLEGHGFELIDYNSFNVLMLDMMPRGLVGCLQRLELRYYHTDLYRLPMIRRHGSDLKLKGVLRSSS